MKKIFFKSVLCSVLSAGCGANHIPPGSQFAMAEVLIRHELASPRSYLQSHTDRCPCFVLVGEQDLPAEQLAALSRTGSAFLPGSSWVAGQGTRIRVGLPQSRWNGNFDVVHSYDCGRGCGGSGRALLRYDGARWRVIDEK